MKRRFCCVVVAAAVVVLGLPSMAAPVQAANPTIEVTTTDDVVDPDDGLLSLREAVTKANDDVGADVIQLAASATYELTICGDPENEMTTYDNSRRNLNAIDSAGLHLEGEASVVQQTCTDASLLHTGSNAIFDAPLEVDGITFDGGSGTVSVLVSGDLVLRNAGITNFEKVSGIGFAHLGAVAASGKVDAIDAIVAHNRNVGGLSGDTVRLVDSVVEDNGGPVQLEFGGIWGFGDVEVVRSRIADNIAGDPAGDPYDWGVGGGIAGSSSIAVTASKIIGNLGLSGGIGHVGGTTTITDSLVQGNHGMWGGGIRADRLEVHRSTIDGNDAGFGGGVVGSGWISDSTISNNEAIRVVGAGGSGGSGGGAVIFDDTTIERSTVTGNTAVAGSGLVVEFGGADHVATIVDSTISDNPLRPVAPDPSTPVLSEISHGQPTATKGELRFLRSVVGTQGAISCTPTGIPIMSMGHNVFSDSSCGAGSATDLVGVGDPMLGPLGDNGGSTPTRVPLAGSPVRDRIPLSDPGCAGLDQRGVERPQGLGCDIGAAEAEVVPAGFVGVSPVRVLDTRVSPGSKVSGPGSIDVKVAGVNGVPAEASAVVVNVTSTEASSADGFVTVWPSGLERPETSTLNLQPGANVASSATIAPGVGGKISLFTNVGATHLIVDVLGYYVPSGDRFASVDPVRVLDTRTGPVPAGRPLGSKLSGPGFIRLPLANHHGIPGDVSAVVVNVTTTEATSANAFVTAWPSGEKRPTASNLNLQPAFNVSNLAFVKLGAGGAIDLFTNAGATHLIVDVVGWFRPSRGDRFLPVNPVRMFDSRDGSMFTQGATQFAPVAGTGGIPADASSVVLNATSTQASSPGGFLTVRAKGTPLPNPLTSNLNYRPPFNAPNQVVSRVGDDHSVALYNGWGTTHIVLDASGYFVS